MGDFSYLYGDLAKVTGDKSYIDNAPKPPPPPAPSSDESEGWWTPERVSHATDYLQKNAGLSPLGAHGLVSRWAGVEARGGPGSQNPNSGAVGIGQWLGARKNGLPSDFDGQLAHASRELNTSEKRAAERLRSAQTPEDAAIGAAMYERAEGYDPKTGADNFVQPTISTMRRLGLPTNQPDYSFIDDDLKGLNVPDTSNDYSFLHQDIANSLGTTDGTGRTLARPGDTQQPDPDVAPSSPRPVLTPNIQAPAPVDPVTGRSKFVPVGAGPYGGFNDSNLPQAGSGVEAPPSSTNVEPPAAAPTVPVKTPGQRVAVKPSTGVSQDDYQKWLAKSNMADTPEAKQLYANRGSAEVNIGTEDLPNPPEAPPLQDVYAGRQGDVNKPGYQTPEAYKAQQENNAVADTIEYPSSVKTAADAGAYVKSQIQAKHPDGDFSKFQMLTPYQPGSTGAQVTVGDLKRAGVDVVGQTKAQQYIENPTPNLNPVPYDFATPAGEAVKDATRVPLFGYSDAPSRLFGSLAGGVGDLTGMMGGILSAANDATPQNAAKEILTNGGTKNVQIIDPTDATDTVDKMRQFYQGAQDFKAQTGAKNADGTDSYPTVFFDMIGQIPKIAVLNAQPTGLIGGFALEQGALAKLKGASAGEIAKQAAKGAVQGAVFTLLPPAVQKLIGTEASSLIKAGIEVPAMGAANFAVGKAFGDPDQENLVNSVAIALFHGYGLAKEGLAGKVAHAADFKGNEVYLKVKPDGGLETVAPQKPDFEFAMPEPKAKTDTATRLANGDIPITNAEPVIKGKPPEAPDEIPVPGASAKAAVPDIPAPAAEPVEAPPAYDTTKANPMVIGRKGGTADVPATADAVQENGAKQESAVPDSTGNDTGNADLWHNKSQKREGTLNPETGRIELGNNRSTAKTAMWEKGPLAEAPLEMTAPSAANTLPKAITAQEGRPTGELIGKADVTRENSHLTINNPETYELIRQLSDDYRAANGLDRQGSYLGLTLKADQLDHVQQRLRELSDPKALKENGYSPEEIQQFRSLSKAFDVAGKESRTNEGKRVVTLSLSPDMVGELAANAAKHEEQGHAIAFLNAASDSVAEQNSHEWRTGLDGNELFKNAENLHRDYAGLPDAVVKHEFITKLATGQFEYLGIDPKANKDAIIKTVTDWANDYDKKNPGTILEAYKQINETTQYFFDRYQRGLAENESGNDGSAAAESSAAPAGQEGRTDVPGDVKAEPASDGASGVAKGEGSQGQAGTTDATNRSDSSIRSEGGREVGVSKIGKTIEAKAIEKGLLDGPGSTAEFDRRHIKDQSVLISNLIKADPDKARQMALGNIPVADGVSPELLHQAYERIAEDTGNVQLIQDLANSKTVTASSFHAQELRFAQERSPDAASTYLKTIKAAREAAASKKLGSRRTVDQAVKAETDKLTAAVSEARKPIMKKAVWQKFISQIEC